MVKAKNARFRDRRRHGSLGTLRKRAFYEDETVSDGPTKLTQETHDRLSAELEDMTTRGRIEIAQHIEAARALGDLSENGDYHAAKDAQGKMEARIRQLQSLLKEAVIVGSIVTVRYVGDDDDDTQDFFVGSIEERQGDLPVASPTAPLGAALMGKVEGDDVEYTSPGGILHVHIVKVSS